MIHRIGNLPRPGILHLCASEFRKHLPHACAQDPGAALWAGRSEGRSTAKDYSVVRRKTEVVQQVLRVAQHPFPRDQSSGKVVTERFGRDNVAANRNHAPAKRCQCPRGVAVSRRQDLSRSQHALVRSKLKARCDLPDFPHFGVFCQLCPCSSCSAGKSGHILRWLEGTSTWIEQAAMVAARPNFLPQIATRE